MFFSAGIGDAVLLIPTVKRLKAQGYEVTGLFNSNMPCAEVLMNTGLLNEIIDARGKAQQAIASLKNLKRYDLAVLNYFACSKKNILTAKAVATRIVANGNISEEKGIEHVQTRPGVHDAGQNLRLVGEHNFSLTDLSVPAMPRPEFDLPSKYVALQVSSGDPAIAYKNWPLDNWMKFLSMLFVKHPEKKFVLLGNQNDIPAAQQLQKEFGQKVLSLAGKTTITQAMQVLSNCDLFFGPDGGLMHLAVAFGKPTFTLWGPSSEKLYGYEQFDPKMHACVRLSLNCFPCNAWIEPNISKANDPAHCPDHACLVLLEPEEVFNRFTKFASTLPPHVW